MGAMHRQPLISGACSIQFGAQVDISRANGRGPPKSSQLSARRAAMLSTAFVVPFAPLDPCGRCTPLHHGALAPRAPSRRPRTLRPRTPRPRTPRPPVVAVATPTHADDIAAAVAARDTRSLPTCIRAHDAASLSGVLRIGLRFTELRAALRLPHVLPALRALATAGHWATVHACLDALWAAVPAAAPDARLLVELANVAVSRRALPQSLRLFAWMDTRGITLGPVGSSVLLKTHERAGNVVAVRAALVRLREEAITFETILLNTAVDALVRCDDIAGARRLVAHPDAADLLDVTTFNTLLKGFANNARVDDAFDLAADMLTAGLRPNLVTTNTLVGVCVAARDFDLAWRLVKLPRVEGIQSLKP